MAVIHLRLKDLKVTRCWKTGPKAFRDCRTRPTSWRPWCSGRGPPEHTTAAPLTVEGSWGEGMLGFKDLEPKGFCGERIEGLKYSKFRGSYESDIEDHIEDVGTKSSRD